MRSAGINLSRFKSVRDVKGEYEAVKGHPIRDRARAVDRATRRLLGR
jgi:hypothetical protein